VAREAGCSKSSLYRRGLSRESLILESIATVWLVDQDPEHPFEAIVSTRAQSFRDRAYALVILMLMDEALRGTDLGKRYLSEAFGLLRQGRAEHLASAISLGEVKADVDADLLLDVVTGALLFRTAHHPAPEPDLADRLVALLRDGIKPRGGM
jgi:AcrR family transcriptional regulator